MSEQRKLTIFSFGNSVLAAVMAVCFLVTFGRALSVFDFSWVTNLLSIQLEVMLGGFLVAMEAQLSRRLLEQHAILSRGWLKAVTVEWGAFVLVLLAAVWARTGPTVTLRNLPALAEMTAGMLTRPEFLEWFFLFCAVWGLSRFLAADLISLENIPTPMEKESQRGATQEQHSARDRLWQDVFFFGGLMVLESVFSLPLAHWMWGMPMDFGTLGLEILVFFLCGLGLFVIGRLMLLQAEWISERTGIDSSVPRQWIGYGLAFVAALLLLAAALPTRYTFQLLTSINLVVAGVSTFIITVWQSLVFILILLVSLILPQWDLPAEGFDLRPPVEEAAGTLPSLPLGISWETVIREILFWGIAILVLVYVLRQILPLRFAVARRFRYWRFFRRLWEFWRRLGKRWSVWKGTAALTLRESWQALRGNLAGRAGTERGGFLNLRGLDPRQAVRFYFFALLRRGAERGTIRTPAQTPREYAAVLSGQEYQIRNELDELTLAFEESRYTRHELGSQKLRRVRRVWDTIRAALRSPKREGEALRKDAPAQTGGKLKA